MSDGRYSRKQEGSGAFGARVQAVIGLTPLTAQVLPGNGSAFRAGSEGSIYAAFGRGCAFPSRRRRGCKGSISRSGIIKFIARRAIPSPLNPLNLLNPLNPHAGGVSNGDTTTLSRRRRLSPPERSEHNPFTQPAAQPRPFLSEPRAAAAPCISISKRIKW